MLQFLGKLKSRVLGVGGGKTVRVRQFLARFLPSQTLQSFNMDKNVSIVKVDKRHNRVIARDNWGLTKEQMMGMHVHHRVNRCDGGTDDPSNLYVCSPSFHRFAWHGGKYARIEKSTQGGLTQGGNNKRNKTGFCGRSPEKMSEDGKKGGEATFNKKVGVFGRSPEKRSEDSRKSGKKGGKAQGTRNALNKTGFCGRSPEKMAEDGRKNAAKTTRQKWTDPEHPELGVHNAGILVLRQKRFGLPHGKENRVRVG